MLSDPALFADLLAHLNKETVGDDAGELQRILAAAVTHVELRVGVRDVLSADLRLAVLIIAGHLYETQRTTQPGRQGFGADGPPAGFSAGFGVPNRAVDLMKPHLLGNRPVWLFGDTVWSA